MKFQSFIKYFDWLETQAEAEQKQLQNEEDSSEAKDKVADENDFVKISRKVFSGKQWLTIEDWLECSIPLCPLDVKHEGRIERSHDNVVQTIFASSRLGGNFLSNGWSQVRTSTKRRIFNH